MAPLWGEPLMDSPHKGPVVPSQMAKYVHVMISHGDYMKFYCYANIQ